MKFGQYVKVDKIKKKIDEDEKTKNKSRQVKECCGDDVDTEDSFEEDTKTLHTIMRFTKTFLDSSSVLEKTECILVIFNILTTQLNQFCKKNIESEEDGGMMFEKKSRK